MTMWHFLLAYLVLAVACWVAAARSFSKTAWWVAAGLAPFLGAVVWFFGLWIQMDPKTGFVDNPIWIVAGHFLLLAALAWVAVKTWRGGTRQMKTSSPLAPTSR